MKKPVLEYAAPYRTGGELYRIIIHQYDETNKSLGEFEVWGSLEAIEDRLSLKKPPKENDLYRFAVDIYEKWREETNYRYPMWQGAFVTNESGVRYGDFRTFPGSMIDPDPLIQTNISLPSSLHKWLKLEAAENKRSISEVIRIALDKYREIK